MIVLVPALVSAELEFVESLRNLLVNESILFAGTIRFPFWFRMHCNQRKWKT